MSDSREAKRIRSTKSYRSEDLESPENNALRSDTCSPASTEDRSRSGTCRA